MGVEAQGQKGGREVQGHMHRGEGRWLSRSTETHRDRGAGVHGDEGRGLAEVQGHMGMGRVGICGGVQGHRGRDSCA